MLSTATRNLADCNRKHKPGDKRFDFICHLKYCNILPDIPFYPKFITYPFSPNRFVEYVPTSLERNYKYDLITEHDSGVTIDLINPDTYAIDPTAHLHPDDEKLLEEDTLSLPQDSKRSRPHNKAVPWLKKTEYISNEFNRYGTSSEKTETKVGYNVKKLLKEEYVYMNRESQIAAINKTFADAKIPIKKHYRKPNVYAVEELPVFPDFQLWRYPFAQVMFDTEPAPNSQMEKMSQAMIRGVMDERGEQFVAYFLPTEDTMRKRKRDAENGLEYEDEDEYEYKMAREYNWNVKNKASKGYEENYFMVFRDGCVYYNELETRVRLSKRRLKPGAHPSNSKLILKHRILNEMEFKSQEMRMIQLEITEEEKEEIQEKDENGDREKKNEKDEDRPADREEASVTSSDSEDENKKEESEKNQESDAEKEWEKEDDNKSNEKSDRPRSSSKANPKASSKALSKSPASSSSSFESDTEETELNKRDEEEIFGSDSD